MSLAVMDEADVKDKIVKKTKEAMKEEKEEADIGSPFEWMNTVYV